MREPLPCFLPASRPTPTLPVKPPEGPQFKFLKSRQRVYVWGEGSGGEGRDCGAEDRWAGGGFGPMGPRHQQ